MKSWGLVGEVNSLSDPTTQKEHLHSIDADFQTLDNAIIFDPHMHKALPPSIDLKPQTLDDTGFLGLLAKQASTQYLLWSSDRLSTCQPAAKKLDFYLHTARNSYSYHVEQLLDDVLSACLKTGPASFASPTMDDQIALTCLRYRRLLKILYRWLPFYEVLDIDTISLLYVITYELAFLTALAAKHEKGKRLIELNESQKHLQAADRLLDLMHNMVGFIPEKVSWFVGLRREFDHCLEVSNMLDSAGNVSDELWNSGLISIRDNENPSTIITRSRVTSVTIIAQVDV